MTHDEMIAEARRSWKGIAKVARPKERFVKAQAYNWGLAIIQVITSDRKGNEHIYDVWTCNCSECREQVDEDADGFLFTMSGAMREDEWARSFEERG